MKKHVKEYCSICGKEKMVKVLGYDKKLDILRTVCEDCNTLLTFTRYKEAVEERKQKKLF